MKLIKLAVSLFAVACLLSGCWWHHHEESHEKPHHSDNHQEHRY